jgi:hypothetical protein
MAELDDEGRIIERPTQIVVSDPADLLPEEIAAPIKPAPDRDSA